MECNGWLQKVDKAAVSEVLPPLTKEAFTEFYQCTACRKVYWKGSHYERMQQLIAQFQADANTRKNG